MRCGGSCRRDPGRGSGPSAGGVSGAMPAGLAELFALLEEEFGIDIWADDAAQTSPADFIDHVLDTAPEVGGPMSDAQRRAYVEGLVQELIDEVLGVTEYDEDATFAEILRSARRR
jgi:hypothetical protein